MTFAHHDLPPLSVAMRLGSQEEHRAAEASTFMSDLLDGRVGEAGYAAYLGQLWHPYAAMEAAVRSHRLDPVVAAVYDPALERLPALEADLAHWSARAGIDPAPPAPTAAVAAYAERLAAATAWGGLLVAHHYTRYLGDLAGGQVIGRMLQRHLGAEETGLAFYDFTGLGPSKPYRDAYRGRLDALDLTTFERARIVAEVQAAFRHNRALLAALDASLVTRIGAPAPAGRPADAAAR